MLTFSNNMEENALLAGVGKDEFKKWFKTLLK